MPGEQLRIPQLFAYTSHMPLEFATFLNVLKRNNDLPQSTPQKLGQH